MKTDPRSKNTFFEGSPQEYLKQYAQAASEAVTKVDPKQLAAALELLKVTTKNGKRIYVAGNGGSAAIADHLCCDITKGAWPENGKGLRTHSLVSNQPLFTALANDYSYEEALSWQIEKYVEPGDVVILISSSGNSPNILHAVRAAKTLGSQVIGFSGFSGGRLHEEADISLYVPFNNYGVVEDAHQMLMHSLAQMLYLHN